MAGLVIAAKVLSSAKMLHAAITPNKVKIPY